jgi:predicted Zn-dependent protease
MADIRSTSDTPTRDIFDQDPEHFFNAGRVFLEQDKAAEARRAFEHALERRPNEPRYLSFTGFAMARAGAPGREAILLCERAARLGGHRPEIYHNLGRVYLATGHRKKARRAFRQGLALDHSSTDLLRDLEHMGIRRPPVFRVLPRGHVVNRYAGKVLHQLGLR